MCGKNFKRLDELKSSSFKELKFISNARVKNNLSIHFFFQDIIRFITFIFIFVKLQIKKDVIDTNGVCMILYLCVLFINKKNQVNKKHIRNNCILTTTFIVQS